MATKHIPRYSGIYPCFLPHPISLSSQMPHRVMTAYASQGILRPCPDIDTAHHLRVAAAAGVFRDGFIHFRRLKRLVKVAGREGQRVIEAVDTLNRVFPEKIVRRVAVVTNRDGVMTGLQPSVIVVLHDVAVGASRRVVGEIRGPPGIDERIPAQADSRAAQRAQYHAQKNKSSMHLLDPTDKNAPAGYRPKQPWKVRNERVSVNMTAATKCYPAALIT